MVLSKREKYIAVSMIAALTILGLDQLVFSPYMAALDDIDTKTIAASAQLEQDDQLMTQKEKLNAVWKQMRPTLKGDESDARSQAEHALVDWSRWAGVAVTSSKSSISTKSGAFQILNYDIGGNTSMAAASRMLWALEQSPIPFRVNEIELSSRPENTDSLTLRLNASTLSMPGEPQASSPTTAPTTKPTDKSSLDKSTGDEE